MFIEDSRKRAGAFIVHERDRPKQHSIRGERERSLTTENLKKKKKILLKKKKHKQRMVQKTERCFSTFLSLSKFKIKGFIFS